MKNLKKLQLLLVGAGKNTSLKTYTEEEIKNNNELYEILKRAINSSSGILISDSILSNPAYISEIKNRGVIENFLGYLNRY